LQLSDPASTDLLRFNRSAIAAGEWWRLLSGNFCHLGWAHLGVNVLGLALVSGLFLRSLTPLWWLGLMLPGSILVGGLLYFMTPNVNYYVGLSAILHGVIVAGAVLDFKRDRVANLILLVGVSVKIIWEQSPYYMDDMSEFIGGNVLVESHFLGTVVGLVVVMFGMVGRYCWKRGA